MRTVGRWALGILAAILPGASHLCVPSLRADGPGPSIVTVEGRQIVVRRRNPDGTLAAAAPLIARGVVYSPAGRDTDTDPYDPDNARVRRLEYGRWYATDLPLIAAMNANVIRLPMDPGYDSALGPVGRALLDEAHARGIYVLMTVDDAVNDLGRVAGAVAYYRDHPAILGWVLGNEWNINYYYGVAGGIADAAARTATAAALVKSLDADHPVFAGYGEIDIDDDGRRLADTSQIVNVTCASVDAWLLNIYRGASFGTLFAQWGAITGKPCLIGEFGADCYHTDAPSNPDAPGALNEAEQRDWDIGLWEEIRAQLSAVDPARVAAGGCVMAWVDEWWKIAPPTVHNTGGWITAVAPDGQFQEEWFGLVDIDRQPRFAYAAFQLAYDPAYDPGDPEIRTVTTLADSGPGSLRQAIADAAPGDRIAFAVTGEIVLEGTLSVNKSLTFDGPGASHLSIARSGDPGAAALRLMEIGSGAGVIGISGISFLRGLGEGAQGHGGAIHSLASDLRIARCAFRENRVSGNGGAISAAHGVSVEGCEFENNAAGYFGGALYCLGSGSVDACEFIGNSATAAAGGAIWGEYQPVSVTDSAFSGNRAPNGGALAMKANASSIARCTFHGNTASATVGFASDGIGGGAIAAGAVYGEACDMTIRHCTVAGNGASYGGGVRHRGSGTVRLFNSIVAENVATHAGPDLHGAFVSQDFNLLGTGADAVVGGSTAHTLVGVPPGLGPFRDNGGPASSMVPAPGSAAIDAGDAGGDDVDQRGEPRPHDVVPAPDASDGTDIGAAEFQPSDFASVSVGATVADAAEMGPVAGEFTVTRTGKILYPLEVTLVPGGSAGADDYVAFGGRVVIPAGSTSAIVPVVPVPDLVSEGPESVTLDIGASSEYAIGSPSGASVSIADDPVDDWRWRMFGARANEGGYADDASDPDGDGECNLEECAFGLDPLGREPARVAVSAAMDGAGRVFEFTFLSLRDRGGEGGGVRGVDWSVRGIRYRPQISAGLAPDGWSGGEGIVEFVGATAQGDRELVTVRAAGGWADGARLFGRVRVDRAR